jgi:hypothetical protein
MTAAEKLEQLKRQRTPHSTEELVRLGEARYKEISTDLEAPHHGDFVMIEVDTGDYFIGSTPQAALDGAQSAYPGKVFYLMRIGYKAAHKLKRARSQHD